MAGISLLLYLLVGAVVYLIYKVNRLERMLGEGARSRKPLRASRDTRVIPILKDDIEPGPFKAGNRRPKPQPETETEE